MDKKINDRPSGLPEHVNSRKRKQQQIQKKPEGGPHRFVKKTFEKPTWCEFAQKFIWGLNKSGYECRICELPVSRRFIAAAKQTVCGEVVMPGEQVNPEVKTRIFTVYLPHGAKKSVLFNPMEPLQSVLEKICVARGINMSEYVAEDTNGHIVELNSLLGKIPGSEITFTKKESKESHEISKTSSKRASITSLKSKIEKSDEKARKLSTSKKKLPVSEIYEFGHELGAGAFSVVKYAKHKETGHEVAIKILDKYEDDDEQTEKFKSEINIISHLKHENIVEFYELDDDEENFYVVMELVDGGELFDYIIQHGAIPEVHSACVIAQVLKAIEYMHSVGIAHRDLKPENLLFKGKDAKIIKIADFGESKSFKENSLSTYCGTPDYMAPEIIRGDPYGPAIDVWSIGVITYVMLGGFPPFDGENDVEVFASILSVKYSFPSPEWADVTEEGKEFIRSIFVPAETRLTASQCLAHPWIVSNVPLELRCNLNPPEKKSNSDKSVGRSSSVPSLSISDSEDQTTGKKKKSKKFSPSDIPVTEEEEFNLQDAKQKIIEKISELMKVTGSQDGNTFTGELRIMSSIISATSGNSSPSELESTIFHLYWERLKEIRRVLKKGGNRVPSSSRIVTHKRKKEKK